MGHFLHIPFISLPFRSWRSRSERQGLHVAGCGDGRCTGLISQQGVLPEVVASLGTRFGGEHSSLVHKMLHKMMIKCSNSGNIPVVHKIWYKMMIKCSKMIYIWMEHIIKIYYKILYEHDKMQQCGAFQEDKNRRHMGDFWTDKFTSKMFKYVHSKSHSFEWVKPQYERMMNPSTEVYL